MQRRYAVAILIGTAVGLFAIASQSIDPWWLWPIEFRGWQPPPNLDLSLSSNLWDWRLPDWDGPHLLQSAQRTKLVEQAYFLKACHLFLEQGLTYLVIPSAISCAYVKLAQLSQNNEVLKDFIVSLKVSFWVLRVFLWHLHVSCFGKRVQPSWKLGTSTSRCLENFRLFLHHCFPICSSSPDDVGLRHPFCNGRKTKGTSLQN